MPVRTASMSASVDGLARLAGQSPGAHRDAQLVGDGAHDPLLVGAERRAEHVEVGSIGLPGWRDVDAQRRLAVHIPVGQLRQLRVVETAEAHAVEIEGGPQLSEQAGQRVGVGGQARRGAAERLGLAA